MLRAIQRANQVGGFARNLQTHAYRGAELSKKLGDHAGSFNRSRIGAFVAHRAPMASKASHKVEHYAPIVSRGLNKLGDIAGKVKQLEHLRYAEPGGKGVYGKGTNETKPTFVNEPKGTVYLPQPVPKITY